MGAGKINKKKILDWAKEVLEIESEAIKELIERLDAQFIKSVRLIYSCKGRIVVTGMGKAGIIGQKFSATLSSLGTPSLWLHPAEAVHGDLGRVKKEDVTVILSYSGETPEIKNLLPFLKKIGSKIIAITGRKESFLAKNSNAVLDVSVKREACKLGLAPTSSTTAMLALCDALSVVIQNLKGFRVKDFAFYHPGGALGKKLLLKVKDIMRKGEKNPIVTQDTKVKEALVKITSCRAGAVSIVDKDNKLVGIFTDGDLRRHLEKGSKILNKEIKEVMTKNPKKVSENMLAFQAAKILKEYKIDELPVVDKKNRVVGMLDIQDVLEAGLM